MHLLCFDIASGGITAAILDSELHSTRSTETQWSLDSGESGAAALSAPNVIDQLKEAIRQLHLTAADRIDAICIDTFLHNCVLLDAGDQPLTPVFTWLDHGGTEGVEIIRASMGERFHQRTGCRFHPMFPVFKLASMRIAGSPAISAVKRIVSVKSLLVHKLSEVWIEDHGIASSSGLFNVQEQGWDPEILDLLGLNSSFFAEVSSRNKIVGRVTRGAAGEFALPEGIPVVNCTGDGFAANAGSGCETPGRISVTLGTSAVVRQTMPAPVLISEAGTFCYMADENAYLLGCAGSNGGNVLDWGRSIFGGIAEQDTAHELPTFIPLLHGERSPEWDPDITGSWHGLTARHTAADLSRSVLEGVVFNLAWFLEIVQSASSARGSDLVLSGNGFLDPLAAPVLAAIAGIPVWMPEQPGLMTLRGAAICGLRALGEPIPPLHSRRVVALEDAKIVRRYAEYRRIRGTLAGA